MTRKLVISSGVAQTRAALLIDDEVRRFWFGPARGDEARDIAAQAGRHFAGKVVRVDTSLAAAFIDLGDSAHGFLQLKKNNEPHCVEGAIIIVEIKSEARQGKGASLRFVEPASSDLAPGRVPPFADPAMEAVEQLGADANEIIVDDGATKRFLNDNGIDHVIHESGPVAAFEMCGASDVLAAAFERTAPIPDGGRLFIDEAQALTAIDVDTGALQASSKARLREKIAIAAAGVAAHQIGLRNIGGQIVIDFPAIPGEAARKRFNDRLRNAMTPLNISAASFSKSGLYTFAIAHKGLSLLERFTETDGGEPVAGRRFTVAARAEQAVGALEKKLRAAPAARFRLSFGEDIERYLTGCPQWSERLADRYGLRFDFISETSYAGRDYDVSEQ